MAEKRQIRGCFKNSTFIVLQQIQNEVNFQRKGSSVVLKIFVKSFKSSQKSNISIKLLIKVFKCVKSVVVVVVVIVVIIVIIVVVAITGITLIMRLDS